MVRRQPFRASSSLSTIELLPSAKGNYQVFGNRRFNLSKDSIIYVTLLAAATAVYLMIRAYGDTLAAAPPVNPAAASKLTTVRVNDFVHVLLALALVIALPADCCGRISWEVWWEFSGSQIYWPELAGCFGHWRVDEHTWLDGIDCSQYRVGTACDLTNSVRHVDPYGTCRIRAAH